MSRFRSLSGATPARLGRRQLWPLRLGLGILLATLLPVRAVNIDFVYTGPLSGSFGTNGNWDLNIVPGSSGLNFRLLIDGNSSRNVTVNVDSTLSNPLSTDVLIDSGDTLNIASGFSITLNASSADVINNGSLKLSSAGANTDLILSGGDVTFSGTGTLTLSNSANNRIYGTNGASDELINGSTHTIRGAGQIGRDLMGIRNAGLILADQSANSLVLDPSGLGLTNTGTLRATNGATLALQNGTITNTGGTIQADDNSHVDLTAVTITGGTLTSVNTGHFHALGSSDVLSGLAISSGSTIEIANGDRLHLSGAIANSGTIKLLGAGASTELLADADTTLSGSGAITLSSAGGNRIYGANGTTTLTNAGNIISGAGNIGIGQLQFVNQGLVNANASGATLTLQTSGSGNANSGTLRASSGGTLTVSGSAYNNTGGIIEAQTGSVVNLSGTTISGGTLLTSGSGSIRASSSTLTGFALSNSSTNLRFENGTSNTIGGTVTNNGTMTINSTGSQTDLVAASGGLTLTGGGTVQLGSSARFLAANGTTTVTNGNNTIRGAGSLGAGQLQFVNNGVVDANTSGGTLTLQASGSGVDNNATLRATNGGTLALFGSTYDNTGGLVEAQNASAVTLGSLTLNNGTLTTSGTGTITAASSTLGGFTVSSGSTLTFANGASNTLSGTVTNNGTLAIASTDSQTDVVGATAGLTLSGGGIVQLSASARLLAANGTSTITNADNTIRGAGSLGAGQLQFVNNSVVDANVNGGTLTLQASGSGVDNNGTLRATNGGTLALFGSTYDNTGGLIEAQTGSAVTLTSLNLSNGTLATSGTGTMTATSSLLGSFTLPSGSTLSFANGSSNTLTGTVVNHGTFSIASTGSQTDVVGGSGFTLSGGGVVQLSSAARLLSVNGTTTLTNSDNTIRGQGSLGAGQMQFVNHAIVDANVNSGTLTLQASGSGVVNDATLRATNGGTLALLGSTFNNAGGTIEAQTGSTVSLTSTNVTSGTLKSSGTGVITSNASTLDSLAVASGTDLRFVNGSGNSLVGTINNRGTLTIDSTGSQTDVVGSAGLILTGGGVVQLNSAARLFGASGATTITNSNNTIRGAGSVGAGQLQLLNHGTVEANATGGTLTLQTSGTGTVNDGTLRAVNGGTLNVLGNTLTNFTNSGSLANGLLQAQANSFVQLTSTTVTGGTLDLGPGAKLLLSNSTVTGGTLAISNTSSVLTNGGDNTLSGVVNNANGGTIEVANGQTLRLVAAGTYNNAGAIKISAAGSQTDLILGGGSVTLGGGGTLTLSATGQSRFYGAASTDQLVNTDNTLQGAGQFGVNQLLFTNHGTVIANQANPLILDPTDTAAGQYGITNDGTFRATAGATLQLQGGAIDNTHGTIEALAGSTVALSSTSITNGTVQTVGTGQINLANSSITASAFNNSSTGTVNVIGGSATIGGAFTNASGGHLKVGNATTLTFAAGTYANDGAIDVLSTGNQTDLRVSGGNVTFTGAGTLTLAANGAARFYGVASSDRLINRNVIQGAGTLGANQLMFTNHGTVIADQAAALVVDPTDTAAGQYGLVNDGIFRATAGATLQLQGGAIDNTSGTIEAQASSTVALSNASIVNGTVRTVGNGQITLSNSSVAASSFENSSTGAVNLVSGSATIGGSFTNPGGGQLNVGNATTLTFSAGTYTNDGEINVLSTGNQTDFRVGGGDVTLAGAGTLTLAANGAARLYGVAGSDRLINQSTIQGAGQFGAGQLTFANQGLVVANQASQPLTLATSGGTANTGTLRATGGATLRLQGSTVANTGGLIEAASSGSTVELSGVTITGGHLASASGASLKVISPSTLSAFQLDAGSLLEIPNSLAATLTGAVVNSGTISLNAGGNQTDLVADSGGLTLTGGGIVELSNSSNNRFYGVGGATVIDNVDNTIRGAGQLGVNRLTLHNTGTIEADQAMTPLTIDLSAAFTNQGTLRAKNGATLQLVDAFSNTGLVEALAGSTISAQSTFTQTTGALSLNGGTFAAASSTISGGLIMGSGTINGAVSNSGVIAPGVTGVASGIGTLTFNDTLTLTNTSLLHFELGGPGSYDQIVAPTVALNGLIVVSFANKFENTVSAADVFTLISTTHATGLSGTFASLPNGSLLAAADGHGFFTLSYNANSLTLSNFTAVPEPSTYALFGVGLTALAIGRRRKRK